MTMEITISEAVYRKLERERGDRTFSEVIGAHLEVGGRLADIAGQGIFETDTHDAVKRDIASLSEGSTEPTAGTSPD